MITTNRPMYVLMSRGVNKNGYLVIELRKMGVDKICAIEIRVNKPYLLNPELAHLLRWYLPEIIPPSEMENLRSQINTIRNKLVNR